MREIVRKLARSQEPARCQHPAGSLQYPIQFAVQLAVVVMLIMPGCTRSTTGPSVAATAGVWELLSVNGLPLPFLRPTAQYTQQIVGEDIILRTNNTFASFTIERFFTGATPPATAPDTVYNLGYWNTTSGDLVIGVASAAQRGDTLTIRSSDRGLSTYVRR
jgi:hypothetical protein